MLSRASAVVDNLLRDMPTELLVEVSMLEDDRAVAVLTRDVTLTDPISSQEILSLSTTLESLAVLRRGRIANKTSSLPNISYNDSLIMTSDSILQYRGELIVKLVNDSVDQPPLPVVRHTHQIPNNNEISSSFDEVLARWKKFCLVLEPRTDPQSNDEGSYTIVTDTRLETQQLKRSLIRLGQLYQRLNAELVHGERIVAKLPVTSVSIGVTDPYVVSGVAFVIAVTRDQ